MPQLIDANELTIEALLNNPSQAYKVPRHQRQFEWTKEQWNDLWEDIHIGQIDESHFLGSIVVIPERNLNVDINYFEVNDGQQRLTTILVLLSSIRDRAQELNNADFAKHITDKYLTASCFERGTIKTTSKMVLGSLDKEEFNNVIKGRLQNSPTNGHRIYECYNFFKSKIERLELEELEILEKRIVKKIIIVHINVVDQLNAFRLFETLNDRGLALSAVDLIKNHLLMRAASNGNDDNSIVDSIVEEWQEMYEKIRDYEPVTFFHRFMLSEYAGKISARQLYEEIKKKADSEHWNDEKIANFTKKLNNTASLYVELIDANIGSPAINRRLWDIKLFEAGPSYTLLLKIAPKLKEGTLSETQFIKIIDLIETFHIRWGLCGLSTSRLSDIYNRICIKLEQVEPDHFFDFIESEYISWSSPINDTAFKSAFSEEFAQPSASRTKYIIWKLGKPAGEVSLNFDEVHTEHIMPQTISREWMLALETTSGQNEENIRKTHNILINKIGNFALIKGEWNIGMSNRPFFEKVKYYANSEIGPTKELAGRENWKFEDIITRTNETADKALQIWGFSKPIPATNTGSASFQPRHAPLSVSDDIDWYCKGPGADAIANIVDNSIIRVRKGSKARLEITPSFRAHNYNQLRISLINEGALKETEGYLVFTDNYDFTSPSAAASIVLGRSADGREEWVGGSGIALYKLSGTENNQSSSENIASNAIKKISTDDYVPFYSELVKRLNSDLSSDYREPKPISYYQISVKGLNGAHFEWGFHKRPKKAFGVELHFEASNKEFNKANVARLNKLKPVLEEKMGQKVIFQPDWGKNWSRIYIETDIENGITEELKIWAVIKMKNLIETIRPELERISQ